MIFGRADIVYCGARPARRSGRDRVRPTCSAARCYILYFSAIAMFGFALMVSAGAIQALRGIQPARFPLAVIARDLYGLWSLAFSRSHSPHHLGPLAMVCCLPPRSPFQLPRDRWPESLRRLQRVAKDADRYARSTAVEPFVGPEAGTVFLTRLIDWQVDVIAWPGRRGSGL